MSKFVIAGTLNPFFGQMHVKLYQADSKLDVCKAILQGKADLPWSESFTDDIIDRWDDRDTSPTARGVTVSRDLTEASKQLLQAITDDVGTSGGDNGHLFGEYNPQILAPATSQPQSVGEADVVGEDNADQATARSAVVDDKHTPTAVTSGSKLFVLGSVDGTRGGSYHKLQYFQADSKLDVCRELLLGAIELPWYGSKADKLIHQFQFPDLEVDEDTDVGFEVSRDLMEASQQLLDVIEDDIENSSSDSGLIFDEFKLRTLPTSTPQPPSSSQIDDHGVEHTDRAP